jgi:hypothetical protein
MRQTFQNRGLIVGLGLGLTILGTIPIRANHLAQAQPSPMAQEILDAHNHYRAAVEVPPLTWSNDLAADAQQWANHLASLGGRVLQHDPDNQDQGENLWAGTADAYSHTEMVNAWGSEQRHFRPGTFPDVSSTDSWADVGHYTQMIWGTTTQVGCATTRAGGFDILVCRYSPPGNYYGQTVY